MDPIGFLESSAEGASTGSPNDESDTQLHSALPAAAACAGDADLHDPNSGDEDELNASLPMSYLPPLPRRAAGYYSEPFFGIGIVGTLYACLVATVRAVSRADGQSFAYRSWLLRAVHGQGALAAACMAHILFAGAGAVRRSERNCRPIPAEVARLLVNAGFKHTSKSWLLACQDGQNVIREDLSSFCPRCLVWRPPLTGCHHCSVCMRCVQGFDHHCGVFGRCITKGNMACFKTLLGLFFSSTLTVLVTLGSGRPAAVAKRFAGLLVGLACCLGAIAKMLPTHLGMSWCDLIRCILKRET